MPPFPQRGPGWSSGQEAMSRPRLHVGRHLLDALFPVARHDFVEHAERAQIELKDRFLLLPIGTVEFPQAHNLAHNLRIEAAAFGFRIDLADVASQCRLFFFQPLDALDRSEEHTSELQSRFGISYAVFCLKKK